MKRILYLPLTVLLSLIATACGPRAGNPGVDMGEGSEQAPAATEGTHLTPVETPVIEATQGTIGDAEPEETRSPAWFTVPLTDVNTGETFTIADHQGKVVLVETMAIWCSNCLQQQRQVKALHDRLGSPEDLVSIGLDIDPNEDATMLSDYTQRNGFDWVYVVSPTQVSHEISQLYGNQFLNPPSTPILLIDRSGEAIPLPFGIKSAETLKEAIDPLLNGG